MIENWKEAWKWFSVQVLALLTIAPVIWSELPEDVKAMIPPEWRPWIIAFVALAGLILRFKAQTK